MHHHQHAAPSTPDGPQVDDDPTEPGPTRRRRRLLFRIALGLAALALVAVAIPAIDLWSSWRTVERESFDVEAFDALAPVPIETIMDDSQDQLLVGLLPDGQALAMAAGIDPLDDPDAIPPSEPPSADPDAPDLDAAYDSYLIVGSDKGDTRADVIILVLLPIDDTSPIMVSLPRDLYLPNRCTQSLSRLNANLNGCGPAVNGPTQLAGAVRDYTGITVDHFALFTMSGFRQIMDAVGGMEICLDHRTRDTTKKLDLPAGCSQVDGKTALAWVRSRHTEELVDDQWQPMPRVSDLTRNQRQQSLLLQVMRQVTRFDSPADLTEFMASFSDAFILDDQLGLREATDLAWSNRDLKAADFARLAIPVRPYTTRGGAQVLLPTSSFSEVLAGAAVDR